MTTTMKDDLEQKREFPKQKRKVKRRVITDDDQLPPTQ